MSDNVRHVMPNNDLIDHQEDEDCVCVPSVEHVTREDGSTAGWMYIHSSLDGREKAETP